MGLLSFDVIFENQFLCFLIKSHFFLHLGGHLLVLLRLQMVVQLAFFLESLLAHGAAEFFDNNLIEVACRQRFFFLLPKVLGQFLSVFAKLFLVGGGTGLFLASLLLFLNPVRYCEDLDARIKLLDVCKEVAELVVEAATLTVTFTLVIRLDKSFDPSIWCVIRVILVNVSELLHRTEPSPLLIELHDIIPLGICISKLCCFTMFHADSLLHLLFFVESLE